MGKSRDIDELSVQAQVTFLKWKDGIDVKGMMIPASERKSPRRRTFYRHRAEIQAVLGVNIHKTVAQQMAVLQDVKYHGEYLIKRDAPTAQGFLPGVLRPA